MKTETKLAMASTILLYAPVMIATAEPIPADPDRFLTFFNSVGPEHQENLASAAAYYDAVDPDDQRTTLADWLSLNDLDVGADADAIYVNDVDLGFGRHMYIKVLGDGRVASYVRNYSDATPADDPVDGPAEEKIANAHNDVSLIATVAMEYGPPPGDPLGEKYTTFYVYGPNGDRLTAADLDGRGAKAIPGICNTCHGGAPRPLLADGSYPDYGDTGAGFLPWDLDSFQYSSMLFDGQPIYSRAAQEGAFKVLNAAVLQTNPTPVVQELVEGWYGGPGMPDPTFNGAFVPSGWLSFPSVYLDAFAPNCRACHLMRNPAVDFSTYQEVDNLLTRAQDLVFDGGVMPVARRTYDRFWPAYSAADLDFQDLLGVVPATRRPGNGAPIAFAGVDRPAVVGLPYPLNASHSVYATSYNWTLLSAPGGSTATLSDADTVSPEFVPDLPGTYTFEVTASNSVGNTTSQVEALATRGVLKDFFTVTGIEFADVIVPIIDEHCISCHTAVANGGSAPPFDEPLRSTREEAIYRNLSLRADASDPAQSLMILKPTEQVAHEGGLVLANPGPEYDKLIAWISQGVLRTIDADDDGLDDRLEPQLGVTAALADSDGDRYYDGVEVVYGSAANDAASVPADPIRLSIDRSGWGGVNQSNQAAVSADGSVVAFKSFSWNLVLNTNSNASSVFVKNTLTGEITEADVDCNCVGSGSADKASITGDGRYVAFKSESVRLVADDTNNFNDVFVTDMSSGLTTRVSTDSLGAESNGHSGFVTTAISGDGRYVAFDSAATNLVDGDNNFALDIFVKDRDTGITTRVSTDSAGAEAQFFDSVFASISTDGNLVAFASEASNLVSGDGNGVQDIFVKDRASGNTTRVSTDSAGVEADGPSFTPRISADGLYVLFSSDATNLVADDNNGWRDAFMKNLDTGEIVRISVDSFGNEANHVSTEPTIDAEGRFVAFASFATNLVPGDGNGQTDIFVKDLADGTVARVSVDVNGAEANGSSGGPAISADGRTVTFHTSASNLADGDDNFQQDVFQTTNPLAPADTDGDGVFDDADNCILVPNETQRDTNGDGFGNICDPDLTNDGIINFPDLQIIKGVFFSAEPDADLNGDGSVNFIDLNIMKSFFFGAPGPSGLAP